MSSSPKRLSFTTRMRINLLVTIISAVYFRSVAMVIWRQNRRRLWGASLWASTFTLVRPNQSEANVIGLVIPGPLPADADTINGRPPSPSWTESLIIAQPRKLLYYRPGYSEGRLSMGSFSGRRRKVLVYLFLPLLGYPLTLRLSVCIFLFL